MSFNEMLPVCGSCLNCPNRTVNCHGSCESYKTFRKKLDKYDEMKRKELERSYIDWSYTKPRRRKTKKRSNYE
jgi:hypothetical protein